MLNEVKSRFMGKSIIKISALSAVILLTAASLSYAQDAAKGKTTQHEMKMDKSMKMDTSMKMGKKGNIKEMMKGNHSSPIAYKGVINLKSIDDNKDGKIYQCPMDFNVLSDKPGVDPKCGMKLKEVTLTQAKNNLTKHGFKVK